MGPPRGLTRGPAPGPCRRTGRFPADRPGSARGVPSTPLRVLTWHVHGSYLSYLTQVPVTWLLPVRPDRADGYGGRGATFTWGDNVIEVPAEEVADTEEEEVDGVEEEWVE